MDIPNETEQSEVKQLAETLLESVLRNDGDSTSSVSTAMNESLAKENQKNPLLFPPVISCALKFLKIKEVKKCRLVSREWGISGKLALARRARISIENPDRRPEKFQSCFLDSAPLFSAFMIYGELTKTKSTKSLTVEELNKFFENHQIYIKELTLLLSYSEDEDEEDTVEDIDISCWISKSPMVQKDTKYMTSLSISGEGEMFDILSLRLIEHIKALNISDCGINLEAGIKICPISLYLSNVTFYQDGVELDRIQINNVVDFCNAKEISLDCSHNSTKYILDMGGNVILDSLDLNNVEIVNGETSQWRIESMDITDVPYSFHNQMKIEKLELSNAGAIDLFTLPTSIRNLTLNVQEDTPAINCSQPIVWKKLKYLQILRKGRMANIDCSFLSHLRNCPKLTHLTLDLNWCPEVIMKSLWIPKSVTTFVLKGTSINWIDDGPLNLKKLVLNYVGKSAKEICKAKIQVDQLIYITHSGEDLVDFLEDRKQFSFGKTLYVGGILWYKKKLQGSVLEKHVDVQSSFYVFENGDKGRAFSKKEFKKLLPKHLYNHWLI